MPEVTITTVAERPELADRIHEIRDTWPAFMNRDKLANALLGAVATTFPEYCLVATADDGSLVARARSIPFAADVPGRDLYPDGGWDSVLLWGFADRDQGRAPTAVSALEVAVDARCQGQGLSSSLVQALGRAAARLGHEVMVAPLRPTGKDREPRTALADYVARRRPDGLPEDPWLRVHVRAGGTVVRVAPASLVISGSLAQWRAWTGLPFDRAGDLEVPGALVPVHCDPTHDHAVYVEPNVWVRHEVRAW